MKTRGEHTPLFDGLVITRKFDPNHQGPPPAGRFEGLGINYENPAYVVDYERIHAYWPTDTEPPF